MQELFPQRLESFESRRRPRGAAADSSRRRAGRLHAVPIATKLEPVPVRRESVERWRTEAPQVAELARHPSENGWIYDRAA